MGVERRRPAAALVAVLAFAAAGCARPAGPPPIRAGTRCVACGMEIADLRFACERSGAGGWRTFDSIECLIHDGGAAASGTAWLADYDGRTLHAADSMWVVHGPFPSPMGGGYAAFLDRATADTLASQTGGTVIRLAGVPVAPESGIP